MQKAAHEQNFEAFCSTRNQLGKGLELSTLNHLTTRRNGKVVRQIEDDKGMTTQVSLPILVRQSNSPAIFPGNCLVAHCVL